MNELMVDSEFKNLIPPLTQEEYTQLEENILKEGCRDSLVVWNGTIVDGHNRYEICTKHNIEFETTDMEFEKREEVIEWIIRNQFGRRNLPNYERAKLALRLKPIIKEKARNKKLSTLKQNTVNQKSDERGEVNTDKELAKIAGVSHNTIWQVGIIENEGSEEVKDQVRKGEISVNKAFNKTRPKVPKEPQEQKGEQKVCVVCFKEKDISEFTLNRGKPIAECRQCVRERQLSGLTRAEAIELNKMFPDEDMKKPPSEEAESSNEKYIRNPIITEFEKILNEFNDKVKKFLYMPQVKNKETKELTNETIKILNQIII